MKYNSQKDKTKNENFKNMEYKQQKYDKEEDLKDKNPHTYDDGQHILFLNCVVFKNFYVIQ